MKIQEKHFFHGAALTQIVEHQSFKSLNKADTRYGHYQVNNCRIIMKYTTHIDSPWQFGVSYDDLTMWLDSRVKHDTFVCLVCGTELVCLLKEHEFEQVIDIEAVGVQWIKVDRPPSKMMRVRGSSGELSPKVSAKRFPGLIFDNID